MSDLRIQLPAYHAAQRTIREADGRFKVLCVGRRFGKSTMGLNLAIETALSGKPAGWFAPTYKLLLEQYEQTAERLHTIATAASRVDMRVKLVTGGAIDFWSLDNVDAGRGRKYARVIIDEASIVRDLERAWEQAIRPTLTDYRGDAWFLGTPKGRNYFERLFQRGQSGDSDWRSWRLGTGDNPYMPADEIAAAKRDLPEAVYRQEYEGIAADDGGNPFGLAAIRAAIAPMAPGPAVVCGVDLAKHQDWTVVIGLDVSGVCCLFDRWQAPWDETMARIQRLVNVTPSLVDATGVGDPILEQLQRRHYGVFEGYVFTQPSKQRLMEGLALALHQGTVKVPDGPIVRELESFEYEYTRTGVRYEAPAGLHDDCVCALALAVQQHTNRTKFRAQTARLLGV
jgi:hypothetical protein